MVIFGAGALGKTLAVLLSAAADVVVYDRSQEVRRMIAKNGIILKEGSKSKRSRVKILPSPTGEKQENTDVLILATKVMDLKDAAAAARGIDPRIVVFMQNGFFDTERFRRYFPGASFCRAVTTMACQEEQADGARLLYQGQIYAGGEKAGIISAMMKKAGIKIALYQDPLRFVMSKLIFNAVMNPLPIITQGGYDILDRDLGTYRLVCNGIQEGCAVAASLGIRLAFDPMALIKRVKDGDLADLSHKGSMFADMSSGRPTEIDHMTGALLGLARRQKIPAPALRNILTKAKDAGA